MKKISKIILATCLFVFNMIYATLIIIILKQLGIDVKNFSPNIKYIYYSLIYLSFMLILFLIFRKDLINNIKDYKHNFKKYFFFGLKCWLIGLFLMFLSNLIIYHYYPNDAVNEVMTQNALKQFPIYMVFSTVIYAPFVEEIIFRKSIKGIFNSNFTYIIVSGLLFGYAHTLVNIGNNMELLYIIPYGVVGAVFAYLYSKTDNIFVPITFHLIHNLIIVSFSLITYF